MASIITLCSWKSIHVVQIEVLRGSNEASHEIYELMGALLGSSKCQNVKNTKGMLFTTYGVLCLTTFSDFDHSKFQAQLAHFHTEQIGASPMNIACKTGELFPVFSLPFST